MTASSPIRVAQVVGKMAGGGVEQVVMNYYRHVDRSRVQFDFLVDADSTLVPREEIESLGGRVFEVPPYQNVLASQRELVRLFREERWPIAHSHMNALSVFPLRAAKRAGVPVRIAHSHSTAGRGRGELLRGAAKLLLRGLANVFPTHRMACSRFAGEWLFGRGADFEVVPNAIELDRFSFDGAQRAVARDELGLDDEQLAVLHVGRFMPQKNHRFLVDVFERVAVRADGPVLLLVGSGGDEKLVRGWVEDRGLSGRVRFLGQRDDVERLYMAADVFCLPSLYEGLPLVAVEAQAAGLACLLSDEITEEVNVTSSCRFLPLGDSTAWANAICGMCPGERFAVNRCDMSGFDIKATASRLCERYLELAAGAETR